MYGKLDPTMSSVSHSSSASSDGSVPSSPIPPVVNGESSGTTALPSSGFTMGAPSRSAARSSSSAAPSAPWPAGMTVFFPICRERGVVGNDRLAEQRLHDGSAQQVRGAFELVGGTQRALAGEDDGFLSFI